ncbi:MAG: heavy-metal-associated domain-containing protein [Beijerinckiaceae bacterium]
MTDQTINLAVKGMTCSGCANAVTRVIQRLDPAAKVTVDLAGGKAAITTAKPAQDFANALTSAGYPANPQ